MTEAAMSSDMSTSSPGHSESHRKDQGLMMSSHVTHPRDPLGGKARVYGDPSPGGI